jgi:gliding motility-associated-like protein
MQGPRYFGDLMIHDTHATMKPDKYNAMRKNRLSIAMLLCCFSFAFGQTPVPSRFVFFKGDSLKDFDFTEAYKRLGAYSAQVRLSEQEKDIFMFRQEKAFIQNKYHLPVTVYSVPKNGIIPAGSKAMKINGRTYLLPRPAVALNHATASSTKQQAKATPPSPLASSCHNLDWEQGDLSGWSGSMGFHDNNGGGINETFYYYGLNPLTGPANAQNAFVGATNAPIGSCSGVTLVSGGTDPYSNVPMVMPGGNFSVRLGDAHANIGAGFTGDCEYSEQVPPASASYPSFSTSEASGEIVMLSFPVTASNCLVTYNYNVILNDPNHPLGNEPYFFADVVLATDTVTSATTCSNYYQRAGGGVPPAGFQTSLTPAPDGSPVFYSGWGGNTIDLHLRIGQTVIIMFFTAGCVPGAHFGYAYIDGSCGPLQFANSGTTVCAGSTQTITAPTTPPGTTYTWSGPGIVGSNTGVTITVNQPGTYSVTYNLPAPNIGCPITVSANVAFLPNPVLTPSQVDNVCGGGTAASATAAASGGNAPYNWAWTASGGGSIGGGATTQTITGLTTGTYTATLTNNVGCSVSHVYTIGAPATLSATSTPSNVACNGASTGSIIANPAGGTTNYTYSWNSAPAQTTQTATGLPAGTYICTITDKNGCTASTSATLSQPPTSPAVSVSSSSNSACTSSTGSITVAASGGSGSYTYTWAPVPPVGQGTVTASGLAPNTYTCTIHDANGCATSVTGSVATAGGPVSSLSSSTNPLCNAACTGVAVVNASGGTGALNYNWVPAPGSGQGSANASAMCAGTYSCTVTDANGCKSLTTAVITAPAAITATSSSVNASCGSANGSGSVNPSGGTGAFTYNWNPNPASGQGTATISNVSAGSYTCTITDANNCFIKKTVNINNSGGPSATTSSTNASCNAACSGTAQVTASGGTGALTYTWSPTPGSGVNSPIATGLCAGVYTCTIKDANGCLITKTDSITAPAALTFAPTSSNVKCNGACNGTASSSVSGGTAPFTYSWSNGAGTGANASGLCPNSYTCAVTDSKGCKASQTITITEPAKLTDTPNNTNVSCNGNNDGKGGLTISGGTQVTGGGYHIVWSPAPPAGQQGSANLNNLPPGSWTCVVTDSLGCTATDSIKITQPLVLSATDSVHNGNCKLPNGVIYVNPAGGNGGYNYSWSNGSTANPLTAGAGTYTCTITDALGCIATVTDSIKNMSSIPVTVVVTTTPRTFCSGGSILLTGSGGNGASYSWSTGSTADSIYVTAGGTYWLYAKNSCGSDSSKVDITVYTKPVVTIAGAGNICPGDSTQLTVSSLPLTIPPTTFAWSTGQTGSTIWVHNNGTYNVTASNPCGTGTSSGAVVVYNIAASFHANIYSGYNPLPVIFTDSSTTTAISWSWNFGDGSATASGKNPTHTFVNSGTYTVTETVLDKNGCKSTFVRTIVIHDLPSWIRIPNVFTPNGDGHNDVWQVEYQGIKSFSGKIFDRWGVLMADLKSVGAGWDGHTEGGGLSVSGTYFYMVHAEGEDGKIYDFKGYLMLIRE